MTCGGSAFNSLGFHLVVLEAFNDPGLANKNPRVKTPKMLGLADLLPLESANTEQAAHASLRVAQLQRGK